MKRADREAHVWLDKMMRADADDHRTGFNAWHAQPGNAEAYAAALDDYQFSQGLSRTRLEAGLRVRSKQIAGRRWAFATILAAAIAVGGAWLVLSNRHEPQIAELPASSSKHKLADGTRVTLMDGATMDARFNSSERRVLLFGGRARFEVAHDASRPFVVEGGGAETVALGTIFEMDLLNPRLPRVALVQGSVEVRRVQSKKVLRLKPGETAEVPLEGPRIMTGPAALMLVTLIEVDEAPVRQILEHANRTNAVPIHLADPALGELRITGRFDLKDPLALARQLAAALNLEVEETDGGPILRKRT